MMRRYPLKFLHGYVFLSLLVFFSVQGLKLFNITNPSWVFHYLNDFLLIPIVGLVSLHAVWYIKKDNTLRLNPLTILSLVTLFSVVFEYYLPQKSYRYTADVLDVICYFMGGVVFYFFQKIQ